MYVLADLEWIVTCSGRLYPTQLAAVRLDSNWETIDSFNALMKPENPVDTQRYVAYAGYPSEAFYKAPSAAEVFTEFYNWLESADVLCWWHREPSEIFMDLSKKYTDNMKYSPLVFIKPYVITLVSNGIRISGNPYKLAVQLGLEIPTPEHCSVNDVKVIQSLLKKLNVSPSLFEKPCNLPIEANYTYYIDLSNKTVHSTKCTKLIGKKDLKGICSLMKAKEMGFSLCNCCREGHIKEIKAFAKRHKYTYVYSPQSSIFHSVDCVYVRRMTNPNGTRCYETNIKHGRVPCTHCNPVEKEPQARKSRDLSFAEKQAIKRFRQAKDVIIQSSASDSENVKNSNYYVLSDPKLSFYASRGYSTFHLRGCSKMNNLSELEGFSYYEDAVKAGYRPCKHCKPTKKFNADFSLPITSKERPDETVNDLFKLCKKNNYKHKCDESYFYFETPVGKWKININEKPVILYHINLVKCRGGVNDYHRQPRLFLSFTDTFNYIDRHDKTLLSETIHGKAV